MPKTPVTNKVATTPLFCNGICNISPSLYPSPGLSIVDVVLIFPNSVLVTVNDAASSSVSFICITSPFVYPTPGSTITIVTMALSLSTVTVTVSPVPELFVVVVLCKPALYLFLLL